MALTLFGKFTRLLLEAEVAPTSENEFVVRYMQIAGVSPKASPHYQRQDNKWGIECRIYFDGPDWVVESLNKLGHHVEDRAGGGYRADYAYRINSQQLFWQLIEHGYRLGPNQPVPPVA